MYFSSIALITLCLSGFIVSNPLPDGTDQTAQPEDGPKTVIVQEGGTCAVVFMMGPPPKPSNSILKCAEGLYCDRRPMMADGPAKCRKQKVVTVRENGTCDVPNRTGAPIDESTVTKCAKGLYCDRKPMMADGPAKCRKQKIVIVQENGACFIPNMTGAPFDESTVSKCAKGLYCDMTPTFADGAAICRKKVAKK